jgi:hypothetical protein
MHLERRLRSEQAERACLVQKRLCIHHRPYADPSTTDFFSV